MDYDDKWTERCSSACRPDPHWWYDPDYEPFFQRMRRLANPVYIPPMYTREVPEDDDAFAESDTDSDDDEPPVTAWPQ